jgi:hypothetical protein
MCLTLLSSHLSFKRAPHFSRKMCEIMMYIHAIHNTFILVITRAWGSWQNEIVAVDKSCLSLSSSAYQNRCHDMVKNSHVLHPLSLLYSFYALEHVWVQQPLVTACSVSLRPQRWPKNVGTVKTKARTTMPQTLVLLCTQSCQRCGWVLILVACHVLQQGPTLHACYAPYRLLPIWALDSETCLGQPRLSYQHNTLRCYA